MAFYKDDICLSWHSLLVFFVRCTYHETEKMDGFTRPLGQSKMKTGWQVRRHLPFTLSKFVLFGSLQLWRGKFNIAENINGFDLRFSPPPPQGPLSERNSNMGRGNLLRCSKCTVNSKKVNSKFSMALQSGNVDFSQPKFTKYESLIGCGLMTSTNRGGSFSKF